MNFLASEPTEADNTWTTDNHGGRTDEQTRPTHRRTDGVYLTARADDRKPDEQRPQLTKQL